MSFSELNEIGYFDVEAERTKYRVLLAAVKEFDIAEEILDFNKQLLDAVYDGRARLEFDEIIWRE